MSKEDLKDVVLIEKRVFKDPWSYRFFKLLLRDLKNYMVTLKLDSEIIGYGGYHLLKTNSNFLNTPKLYKNIIHLINIAIKPEYQRKGYGTFLLNKLLTSGAKAGAEYCYLEVRPSNIPATSFYKKAGFKIIGVIEDYYTKCREDALVMGKELKPTFIL